MASKPDKPPSRTVWIGDLDGTEDAGYFERVFAPICKVRSFKLIKEPNSNSYYGFVECESVEQAALVIRLFNGKPRPFSQRSPHQDFSTELWTAAAEAEGAGGPLPRPDLRGQPRPKSN